MARWLNRITHSTVVVHTVDKQSLKGVLRATYSDCLVLVDATFMGPAGDGHGTMNVPVDGQVAVPRDKVAWVQVLPAEVRS